MIEQIASEIVALQEALAKKMANLESMLNKLSDLSGMVTSRREKITELQNQLEELKIQGLSNADLDKELDYIYEQVNEAASAVSKISNSQLEEVSKYMNPPERIKIALEAIMCLLHQKVMSWDQIKSELNKNLLDSVSKFNLTKVPQKIIKLVQTQYLNHEKWDLDKLKHASKSMGPLGDWLKAQLLLAEIMEAKPQAKEILARRHTRVETQRDLECLVMEMNHLENERKSIQVLIDNEKEEFTQLQATLEVKKKEYEVVRRSLYPHLYKSDIGIQTDPDPDFPEDEVQLWAMGSLDGYFDDDDLVEDLSVNNSGILEESKHSGLGISSQREGGSSNGETVNEDKNDGKANKNSPIEAQNGSNLRVKNNLNNSKNLQVSTKDTFKNGSARGVSPKTNKQSKLESNSSAKLEVGGKSNRGVNNSQPSSSHEQVKSFKNDSKFLADPGNSQNEQDQSNPIVNRKQRIIKGTQTIDFRYMRNKAEIMMADELDEGLHMMEEPQEIPEFAVNLPNPTHDSSVYQIEIPGVAVPAQQLKPDFLDSGADFDTNVTEQFKEVNSLRQGSMIENSQLFGKANKLQSGFDGQRGNSIDGYNDQQLNSIVSSSWALNDGLTSDKMPSNNDITTPNQYLHNNVHTNGTSHNKNQDLLDELSSPLKSQDSMTNRPDTPDDGAVRLIKLPERACQADHLARDYPDFISDNQSSLDGFAHSNKNKDGHHSTNISVQLEPFEHQNRSLTSQNKGSILTDNFDQTHGQASQSNKLNDHLLHLQVELTSPSLDKPDSPNSVQMPRVDFSTSGASKFGNGRVDGDSGQNIIPPELLTIAEEPKTDLPEKESSAIIAILQLPEKPPRKIIGKVLMVKETKTIDSSFLKHLMPNVKDDGSDFKDALSSSTSHHLYMHTIKRSVANSQLPEGNDFYTDNQEPSESNLSSYNRRLQVTRALSPYGNVYYGKRCTIGNNNALASLKQKGTIDTDALEHPRNKYENRREENIQFKKEIFVNKIQEMEPAKAVDYIVELEKSLANNFIANNMSSANNDISEKWLPSQTQLVPGHTSSNKFYHNVPFNHKNKAFESQSQSFIPSSSHPTSQPSVWARSTPQQSNYNSYSVRDKQPSQSSSVLGNVTPPVHIITSFDPLQAFENKPMVYAPKIQRNRTPTFNSGLQTILDLETRIQSRSISPIPQNFQINKKQI